MLGWHNINPVICILFPSITLIIIQMLGKHVVEPYFNHKNSSKCLITNVHKSLRRTTFQAHNTHIYHDNPQASMRLMKKSSPACKGDMWHSTRPIPISTITKLIARWQQGQTRCLPLLRLSFEKYRHKVTRPPLLNFIAQKGDQVQRGVLLLMYVKFRK